MRKAPFLTGGPGPRRVAAGLIVLLLAAGPGPAAPAARPAREDAAARPPVIVLLIDTLRGDHLGCAGSEWVRTPAFDRLARDGVRFTNCFAAAPWTLPAVASLYTGRLPYHHGAVGGDYARLPDRETTLAEHLRGAGYATAGYVAINYLDSRFGMAQGFQRFQLLNAGRHGREAERVTAAGTKFAVRHAGVPFLLLLHYFDVHAPYEPPAPYDRMYYQGNERARGQPILTFLLSPANKAERRQDGMYDWLAGVTDLQFPVRQYGAGVSYVDHQAGRVLDALRAAGLYDRALIVLVADHGEHLGEHDIWFTHLEPYQETLHVPLIVKLPGNRQAGRVVEEPVSSVDLLPTILALTGVQPPDNLDGRSLAGALAGHDDGRSRIFAEQGALPARHSKVVVEWPWKLLLRRDGGRDVPELYDLGTDPGETRNVAADRADVCDRLRRAIRQVVDPTRPLVADTERRPAAIDAATDRRLRALGY